VNQSGIGIIDGADTFGVDFDYVDCGSGTDLEPGTGDFTIEMWMKRVAISGTIGHFLIAKRGSDGYAIWMSKSSSADQIRFYAVAGSTIDFQGGSTTDFNWHHVAVTLDRDGNAVIYKDGSPVATTDISSSTGSISSASVCSIGNNKASTWDHDGTIDEVRLSNVARSGDWIDASYNNQYNPSGFYSVLDEEVTAGPVVSDPVPVHDATLVEITLTQLKFNLSHKDDTLMDYSVETSPSIGSASVSGVGNGTKTVSVSGLSYSTVYTWFVNTSDGSSDVNMTFMFTTEPANSPPVISSPIPVNSQTGVPLTVGLSVYVSDIDVDPMDVTFRTNASGSWADIGSNNSVGDGRYSQGYTFPDYNILYYWSANVSDGALWDNETYVLTTERVWWDTEWAYRKSITVDNTKINSDLTDFPVLVSFTDAGLIGKTQSDGDDLVFTDAGGVVLSHEIELFNSGTGELVCWVKVPLLYSSVDTVLYMYYGNSAVGNQEDAVGVWDAGYTMVQHLSETSGTHYDSTSFDNDATGFNGLDQDAAGKIDGCDDFDALDDYIDCGTSSSLNPGTGDYTIEAWVKRDNTGVNHVITSKRASYPGVGYLFWIQPDHSLRFYCEDASGNSASIIGGSIGDTSWHHVAVTLDRGGNGVIYTDGSAAVTTSIAGLTDSIDPSRLLTVGIQYQISGTSLPFNGSIDEVRVSNVARSNDWIDTGYNNYNNPGTFFSVGAEEYTPAPVVTSPVPANDAVDVAITITDL
ncbi:DUF2341 domain-containing protein, partial [Thermoplasmatota archaeon]